MSTLELTPPSRELEAWKYVTPSLLKELSSYKLKEQCSEAPEQNGLILQKGEVLRNSTTLIVQSLSELSPEKSKHIPNLKTEEKDCFSDLAYQQAGLFIEIPASKEKAIYEITIANQGDHELSPTRLHIHIPKLNDTQINIHLTGIEGSSYANLCELSFYHEVASNTKICVLGDESSQAMTLTGFQHQLMRDSHLSLQLLNGETKLTRHRLHIELCEDNAEAEVCGIGSLAESGSLHHQLQIHHKVPNCRSRQLFKTALGGKARSSFDGTIQVAEKAIQTEADQMSRYLLLSPDARASAKPQLKIYADDVVCTHGSTIGQLEEEELFYLQTRGLSREQSHHLLARGFVEDVLADCHHQAYAKSWREKILNRQFPLLQA